MKRIVCPIGDGSGTTEPGYYEARDNARAGAGAGMQLDDAIQHYRAGQ